MAFYCSLHCVIHIDTIKVKKRSLLLVLIEEHGQMAACSWQLCSFFKRWKEDNIWRHWYTLFNIAHVTCQLLLASWAWDKTFWVSWTNHMLWVNLHIHVERCTGLLCESTQTCRHTRTLWPVQANLNRVHPLSNPMPCCLFAALVGIAYLP